MFALERFHALHPLRGLCPHNILAQTPMTEIYKVAEVTKHSNANTTVDESFLPPTPCQPLLHGLVEHVTPN